VTALAFLSPDEAAPDVAVASPLRRVLAGAGGGVVTDVSALGKLEVRGPLERVAPRAREELIRIAPTRGLLVTDGPPRAARERLRAEGVRVYDLTAALAGLEVEGVALMRRLTELDLDALPTAGAILRGTSAILERRGGERFRLFVPQELGHYVAETILDLAQGLAR
jgi:hypothetical protein